MDTKPVGLHMKTPFLCVSMTMTPTLEPQACLSPFVPWEGCFVLKSDSVAEMALPSSGEENDVFFPNKYLQRSGSEPLSVRMIFHINIIQWKKKKLNICCLKKWMKELSIWWNWVAGLLAEFHPETESQAGLCRSTEGKQNHSSQITILAL